MKDLPLRIKVKVVPGSNKNCIVGEMADGVLKIKIAAAPDKEKANKELISFLSSEYSVPKKNVQIISGAHSPLKIIEILK
ncbi:DUF167 domain-containing protein [Pseudomonadota bacterium]